MQIVKLSLFLLTKLEFEYIIIIEKRQDLKRLCQLYDYLIKSNRHGNGGYSAFMEKIIKSMIISKIANSNFFTISNMLTFHKHPSFHKLGILPVYVKVGITAGEYTVKKSCLIGLLRQVTLYTIIR